MHPSGLLLFLMVTVQNSTPYPRHLLCSPQRPMAASYHTVLYPVSFEWMETHTGSLPSTMGQAQGRMVGGGGQSPLRVPGAILSCSDLFHSPVPTVDGVSVFSRLG